MLPNVQNTNTRCDGCVAEQVTSLVQCPLLLVPLLVPTREAFGRSRSWWWQLGGIPESEVLWADLQTRLSVGCEAGEVGRTLPCRCRRSISVGVYYFSNAIIPGERYNGGFVAFGRRDLSVRSDSLD